MPEGIWFDVAAASATYVLAVVAVWRLVRR